MSGRWARTGTVLVRRLGAGVLLLPRRAEAPFLLTGAGVDLWDRLAEPATLDDIVAEMARRYDLPAETVSDALDPVMQELVRRGAIVEAAPAGSQRADPATGSQHLVP